MQPFLFWIVLIFQVGSIIGKGGETIKNLQTRSEARIQVVIYHSWYSIALKAMLKKMKRSEQLKILDIGKWNPF